MTHVENKIKNGRQISNLIRNSIKCERTKQSRQKAEVVRLHLKKKTHTQKDQTALNYMRSKDIHIKLKDTKILKLRGWKRLFHANGNHRKAILISNKTDFKLKKMLLEIKRDIYNDKRVNPSKRCYNNYKHMHIQKLSPKYIKFKPSIERKHRQLNNNR